MHGDHNSEMYVQQSTLRVLQGMHGVRGSGNSQENAVIETESQGFPWKVLGLKQLLGCMSCLP